VRIFRSKLDEDVTLIREDALDGKTVVVTGGSHGPGDTIVSTGAS
jgi:hypothetical protein